MYDQAQSARLGQRTAPENPGIRIVADIDDVETPYQGQLAFVTGDSSLKLYVDAAWVDIT